MPELPEVETIRRQLDPELAGARILRLEVLDEKWSRPTAPGLLEEAVTGSVISGLGRRGKYFLLGLSGGRTLVIHLRMTGNLLLVGPDGSREPGDARLDRPSDETRHLRARFILDGDRELWFTDARRFGTGMLIPDSELDFHFSGRLGVEPFSDEFTPELLAEIAGERRVPLKSFLLDQAGVAGIGNIYADEALYRARLHPLSPAGSMKAEHRLALRDGVVESLRAGLDNGGASIDDYRDSRGEKGEMQNEFLVHRREGEGCPGCGTPIMRIVVSGRSTYYCPNCQIRLRKRPKRKVRPPSSST